MTPAIANILQWSSMSDAQRRTAMQRPEAGRAGLEASVSSIINAVRERGDAAVREFSQQFDGVELSDLQVDAQLLADAERQVAPELLNAMDRAAGRIRAFHQASAPRDTSMETTPGLLCASRYLPISPIGLYVPGGTAPLISTVMMLAIPAAIANCREVVLCSPPDKQGQLHPALLAAAARCGVRKVFRIGGAQAIAAMAFGTESIPACNKLFGPGNAWVTEAKRQVAAMPGGAAQDMPAGPSEVLVIADSSADPTALAWDLLSQAEHGPDSQAILLSDDAGLLASVRAQLPELAASLPRYAILQKSLQSLRLVQVNSLAEAMQISNQYAPEHLIINCLQADELAEQVTAAGSVFLGPWTPESLGDYSAGSNHVLPTYGHAKAYGGLSVADFQRRMTVQTANFEALAEAGADAMQLARAEGLDAHRMAVQWRLQNDPEASHD